MQFNRSTQYSAVSTQHSASNGSTWHLAFGHSGPLVVSRPGFGAIVQGLNAECSLENTPAANG